MAELLLALQLVRVVLMSSFYIQRSVTLVKYSINVFEMYSKIFIINSLYTYMGDQKSQNKPIRKKTTKNVKFRFPGALTCGHPEVFSYITAKDS